MRKATIINFFTIDSKGIHRYEFTSIVELNQKKPLTKILIKKTLLYINILDIKKHTRNYVYFNKPINISQFKQKNVVCFYCNKHKI